MFDHYIGLDWSVNNMAIANLSKNPKEDAVIDVKSDIKDLQNYLSLLKGTIAITFEESTPAQWLFTELREFVDEVIVCDPYRNKLLKDGPKNDKLDALKLVKLLKAGMLKPVFHCTDEFIYLRKLVSGYEDLVRGGVRNKNQRLALFRGQNKFETEKLENQYESFVLTGLDTSIELYEQQKKLYDGEFLKAKRKYKVIKNLESIPGIGPVGAITIAATVVDARRFKNKNNFLSYCGLIKHDLMSGGRSYGKRSPRYCRRLKAVFKTAAMSCTIGNRTNLLSKYYYELMDKKNYPEHKARHAVARRIAVLALGVMKSNKELNDEMIIKTQ